MAHILNRITCFFTIIAPTHVFIYIMTNKTFILVKSFCATLNTTSFAFLQLWLITANDSDANTALNLSNSIQIGFLLTIHLQTVIFTSSFNGFFHALWYDFLLGIFFFFFFHSILFVFYFIACSFCNMVTKLRTFLG